MALRRISMLLTVLACAAGALADAPAAPDAARRPDNAGAPPRILLKQRFPVGTFDMVIKTEMVQEIHLPGAPQKMAVTQEMTARIVVAPPDAAGEKKVSLTYTRIKMQMPMMTYDSDKDDAAGGNPLAGILGALLKAKIVITTDKDDKITKVEGMDKIWDNMARAQPGMKTMLDGMKKQMGDSMVKQMVGASQEMMPKHKVGKGAIWHAKTSAEVPMIGQADTDSECELVDLQGAKATITSTTRLKSAGGGAVPGMPAKIGSVDLKMTGKILMATDTGLAEWNQVKQEGKIELTQTTPDGQTVPITIDMKGTTTTTVTPAKPGGGAKKPAPKQPAPDF